jgi:hypothetical protein
MSQDKQTQPQVTLQSEYAEINSNVRFLADVRFKLLALLPVLGGAAVFVLAKSGLEAGKPAAGSMGELLVVVLVSTFGFLATLGIALYDQRNSQLYNALIHRAKYLEKESNLQTAPGGLRQTDHGGQFNERPEKGRRLILVAGHDLGLALIYGPILSAWSFPALYAVLRLAGVVDECSQFFSIITTVVATLAFTMRLIAMDRQELQLYRVASTRDGLTSKSKTPEWKEVSDPESEEGRG